MNSVVKKLWVDALRSGKYEKGSGSLRQRTEEGDCFCCLGVLCDLYARANPGAVGSWHECGTGDDDVVSIPFKYLDGQFGTKYESEVITPAVREWAGLRSDNPVLVNPNMEKPEPISVLNDQGGLTFDELATLIEEQL